MRFAVPPDARPPGWFDDVATVVEFLRILGTETGRDFILGASFEGRHGEDLFDVGAGHVDLEEMRMHLGG
jgi:hypothetical protein